MRMTRLALEKLKQFEGCRLKTYRDAVGALTIGYGSTSGVYAGMVITQEEADRRLLSYIEAEESTLLRIDGVSRLTDYQFDAIVSFAYNVGINNLKKSTLLKKLQKNPDDPTIPSEFLRWTKAGPKTLKGLVKRRAWEASRYMGNE